MRKPGHTAMASSKNNPPTPEKKLRNGSTLNPTAESGKKMSVAAQQHLAALRAAAGSSEEKLMGALDDWIATLETEQREARQRIDELANSKRRFEKVLQQLRLEKQQQGETKDTRLLQKKLTLLIQEKEAEQQVLKDKIRQLKEDAESEIEALRQERDAALELANQRQELIQTHVFFDRRQFLYISGGLIAFLLLAIIFLISWHFMS